MPGGLEAHLARPRSEVVLWDPAAGALIPGDALLGDEDGGVRMCPRGWLPQSTTIEQLRQNLAPLPDLPVKMVVVSHGEPVLTDAQAALAKALG